MLRNRVFSLRIFQICVMPNCKHNGYMHLTNRFSRLWNFQVSAVRSCCTSFRSFTSYKVDLLMISNRVFRLRNAQNWRCLPECELICWFSGIAYSGCKTFKYGKCRMKELLFPDAQESRFQGWNRSYMGSAVLKGGRFYEVQELRFKITKRKMCEAASASICWLSGLEFSGCERFIYV